MATQYLLPDKRDPKSNASYKSGTAPVAGDTAVWADGNTDIDTNLDWEAVDLQSIIITPTKGGNVGGQNPFQTVINQSGTGTFLIYGSGQRYFISAGGAANVIHEIQFRPSAGGHLLLINCTNANLSLEAGSSTIETSVILGDVVISGEHSAWIKSHASDVINLVVAIGQSRCLLERDFTTARVAENAELVIDLTAPSGVAGGTVEMYGGTLFPVRGSSATINAYGGVIDATRLKENVTFTNGVIYPGVTIRRMRNGPTLDISGVTLKYGGPKIVYVD